MKAFVAGMDVRLPQTDGYEVTRGIRKTEPQNSDATFRTVIIAITASAFEEERAVALSMGCDAFLRKPFREPDLFKLMQRCLGLRFVYEAEKDVPDTPYILSGLPGIPAIYFFISPAVGSSATGLSVQIKAKSHN